MSIAKGNYMPKISVVTPAYNASEYILDCAESVLSQTHKNIEWLVVDDGSTDDTLLLLGSLEEKDKRVKVFTQENQGPAAARNKAFEEIKGDYFSFIDADDVWHPDFLSGLHKLISQHKADLVSCNFREVSNSFQIGDISNFPPQKERIDFFEKPLNILPKYPIDRTIWNKLYRTKIFKSLRFLSNMASAEDIVFSWQVRALTTSAVQTSAAYTFYRNSTTSISRRGVTKGYIDDIYCIAKALDELYIQNNNFSKSIKTCIKREIARTVFKGYVKKARSLDNEALRKTVKSNFSKLVENGIFEPCYLPVKKRASLHFQKALNKKHPLFE